MKVNIRDKQLHIEVFNPNNKKQTLIWTHGLMNRMGSEDLAKYVPFDKIAEEACLIRYDVRGHGKSEIDLDPEHHTAEDHAKDLLAIADYFDVDQFITGGFSMGTSVSLWAATQAPDRITGMILDAPPNAWEKREISRQRYHGLIRMIERFGIDAAFERFRDMPLPDHLKGLKPVKKFNYDYIGSQPQDNIIPLIEGAILSDFPPEEKVSQLTIPALILAWWQLDLHKLATAEKLAKLLKNAKFLLANSYEEACKQGFEALSFIKNDKEKL